MSSNSTLRQKQLDHCHLRRLSYELLEDRRMLATYTVTNLQDGPVDSEGDLPGSLRQAVFDANSLLGEDIIFFDLGTSGGTINLSSEAEIYITDSVAIVDFSSAYITIAAYDPTPTIKTGDGNRIFRINNNDDATTIDVELFGMRLRGGDANGRGGAIANGENLIINSCILTDNFANLDGGAIYHTLGDLKIVNSHLTANSTNLSGGAVFASQNTLEIVESVVTGNTAAAHGGAVYQRSGTLAVEFSYFSQNQSNPSGTSGQGGAIFSQYSSLVISDSIISGNQASRQGGGIFSSSANLSISRTSIYSNLAYAEGSNYGSGGGIYAATGNDHVINISNCTISNNQSMEVGGIAVHSLSGTPALWNIEHSTVAYNEAGFLGSPPGSAGGIRALGAILTIDQSIVAGNKDYAAHNEDLGGESFLIRYSLIGTNIGSGYAPSPFVPDSYGNLLGPIPSSQPIHIYVAMAAMGDFEAGSGGDSFRFEYSLNGAPFQTMFDVLADENTSMEYELDNGFSYPIPDPLYAVDPSDGQRFYLYNDFRFLQITLIPENPVETLAIRFQSSSNDPGEAFAWRELWIEDAQHNFIGSVTGAGFPDVFTSHISDSDLASPDRMFGIRSRGEPGIPGLPGVIIDDSAFGVPIDRIGIVGLHADGTFDDDPFFGVADSGTRTSTWTFAHPGAQTLDPKLGQFAYSGGRTPNYSLKPDSPALNAGDPSAVAGIGVPATDQRGDNTTRVFNGRIDIGAYEAQRTFDLVVSSTSDSWDGLYGNGYLTFREAIAWANFFEGPDIINFSPLFNSTRTITLSEMGDILISDDLTISGPSPHLLTVKGYSKTSGTGDGDRIFTVDDSLSESDLDVVISAMRLQQGDSPDNGGAIQSRENLTLMDCIITGNFAPLHGGAIHQRDGSLNVVRSSITNNGSGTGAFAGDGGGIYTFNADVMIIDSAFSDNHAYGNGGGLFVENGNVSIVSSTLNRNLANLNGGAIRIELASEKSSIIRHSTISSNRANVNAGGIYIETNGDTTSLIEHTTITMNIADADNNGIGNTGGLYQTGSTAITINHSVVAYNINQPTGYHDLSNSFNLSYSLIGNNWGIAYDETGVLMPDTSGNLIGGATHGVINPLFGPLQNNGGPTFTHALLAGSPAIDAGDPAFASPPDYDQRGTGYERVANGRIDMGAFEVQAAASLPGDYNGDGVVTGRDFLIWQRGQSPVPFSSDDLESWQEEYNGGALSALSASIEDEYETYEDDEETTASLMFVNSYSPPATPPTADSYLLGGSPDGFEVNDSFVESVDLAIEELSTISTYGVREFGDLVVRRKVSSRLAVL